MKNKILARIFLRWSKANNIPFELTSSKTVTYRQGVPCIVTEWAVKFPRNVRFMVTESMHVDIDAHAGSSSGALAELVLGYLELVKLYDDIKVYVDDKQVKSLTIKYFL